MIGSACTHWKKSLCSLLLGLSSVAGGAEAINPEAGSLRQLAMRHEHGRGMKVDYQEAYRLYCKAALLGDAQAAYNLGWMYFNGRGFDRNIRFAIGWFRRAATAGDPYATRMLGRHMGISAEQDPYCHPPSPARNSVAGAGGRTIEGWARQIAPRFSIDPELVLAVIQAESGFDAVALSNRNAQGLMQLIPATAERFGVKDVWDPIENILGGTAYLHWLIRHFSGDVKLVLAAYNAGEGAVEQYKDVPPYEETRNYVRRILTAYKKVFHPVPPDLPDAMKAVRRELTAIAHL
jgi:hypothetical protein